MTKKWTLSECHKELGTVPKNPRWSWSGRSTDGTIVAVQLWQDLFSDGGKAYATGEVTSDMPWVGTPGHNELINNLCWARDHCDSKVKIIVATAVDTSAHPRSIKECFPLKKLTMQIQKLVEETGEFTLIRA